MILSLNLFFDVYFYVRPLDWLFLLIIAILGTNLRVSHTSIITIISITPLALYLNNLVFFCFGLFCLLLLKRYYARRSFSDDLLWAIWFFTILFFIDYVLTKTMSIDVKSLVGLRNENYEGNFERYSGLLSEASNVGNVLFLLIMPYLNSIEIKQKHLKSIFIWSLPGLLSLSITSQIFTLMWLGFAFFKYLSSKDKNAMVSVSTMIIIGLLCMSVFSLFAIGDKYASRLLVFYDFIKSPISSEILDGSMKDRFAGSLGGLRYADNFSFFGTSVPSGYKSIFGVLFQVVDLAAIILLLLIVAVLYFSKSFGMVYWFVCILLLPNQFITTTLFYVSLYCFWCGGASKIVSPKVELARKKVSRRNAVGTP